MACLIWTLAPVCPCQQPAPEDPGPYASGVRLLTVPGVPGGNGTVELRVHYPATMAGTDTPLDPSGAPYGLAVFGHAWATPSTVYDSLAIHHASRGLVSLAVATEDAVLGASLERYVKDMHAAVLGMRQASADPLSPLFFATSLDTKAVFMGHGHGGTAAVLAAFERPDLAIAVATLGAYGLPQMGINIPAALSGLLVPALHIGGSEDLMAPPSPHLDVLYNAPTTTGRMIEIAGANHSSFHEAFWYDRLLEPPPSIGVQEQQRLVRRYTLPFLEWQIHGQHTYTSLLLGPEALSDLALARQATRLNEALLFAPGDATIGSVFAIHAARLPTDAAYFVVGIAVAPVPTPFGTSFIHPAGRVILPPVPAGPHSLASLEWPIPAVPALQGATFPCQAFLATSFDAQLSNLWLIQIR